MSEKIGGRILQSLNRRHVLGGLCIYLSVLACLVVVWAAFPRNLYVGRDGLLSLWLARMHSDWGTWASMTAQNPFQGQIAAPRA